MNIEKAVIYATDHGFTVTDDFNFMPKRKGFYLVDKSTGERYQITQTENNPRIWNHKGKTGSRSLLIIALVNSARQ